MTDNSMAEVSTVGAILIDERCLPDIRRVLPDKSVFASAPCARIYDAACALADEGKPVDPVTVRSRCPEVTREFLVEAMQLTPTAANVAHYAQQVWEGYKRRTLASIGLTLREGDNTRSADELLTDARAALDALAACRTADTKPGSDLNELFTLRGELEDNKREIIRLGFPSLNSILGGLQPGGLYLIAARPSIGKSAFGIALADMLAAKGKRVLFLSLEMSGAEIAARRVASASKRLTSYQQVLFRKHLDDELNADLCATIGTLSGRPLTVRQVPRLSVAQAGVLARNTEAQVLFIDYLGLMSGVGKTEYERVTAISGDLKRLASTLGIVVVGLCQLNRETELNAESRPKLSQLRSSGALEQDADAVMLLHRPQKGQKTLCEPFEIAVAKNRHGSTGSATLTFYPATNRFEDTGVTDGRPYSVKSWAG